MISADVKLRLALDFTQIEELILGQVSFFIEGSSDPESKDGPQKVLRSYLGEHFHWTPGPRAVTILLLRSVAAALEQWNNYSLYASDERTASLKESGAERRVKKSNRDPKFPSRTIANCRKNLNGSGYSELPWFWDMFGADPQDNSWLVREVVKIERGHVFVNRDVLSPGDDIVIQCNGVQVRDASALWKMADTIESKHFPQAYESRTNLPRKHTQLFGRQSEFDKVVQLLMSRRLVTIVGAGGCGKTALCYEVARRIEHGYAKGRVVELADLPGDTDYSLLVREVARTISPNLAKGRTTTVASIARAVGDKRMLLILDNCEHLTEVCNELVTQFLNEDTGMPNLQIMATSREPLGCRDEEILDLAGLAFPPEGFRVRCLADLDDFPSATLFMQRARDPQWQDEDAADIAIICRTLEGIPHSLEIVAAQASKRSIHQVVQSLDHILTLETPNAKHRHQKKVEATLEWSYSLLSEEEQAVLRRLSLFVGGWTREAVNAACNAGQSDKQEVNSILDRLVDKSLIELSGDRTRLDFLMPTRMFADTKLSKYEREKYEIKHASYFLKLALDLEPMLSDNRQMKAMQVLECEQHNIQVAIDRSLKSSQNRGAGLRMAVAITGFWRVKSSFSQGRQYIEKAIEKIGVEANSTVLAHARQSAGLLAWAQGDFVAAEKHLQSAIAIWEEIGGEQAETGVADALHHLGMVAADANREDEALAYYESALNHSEALMQSSRNGHQLRHANVLISLGVLHEQEETGTQLDKAQLYMEEALELARELGEGRSVSIAINNLGFIARKRKNWPESGRCHTEALRIRLEMGDRLGIAWSLEGVARLATELQEIAIATQLFSAAKRVREEIDAQVPPKINEAYRSIRLTNRKSLGDEAFKEQCKCGYDLEDADAVELAVRFCRSDACSS